MNIKKFNEAEETISISNERVDEIIIDLSSITSEINSKSKTVNEILNELENYKTKSTKSNNQIDESTISLNSIGKKLDECTTLIDNVISLLKDYNQNGSKYLY
jgi:uncharacterized coiled-coil DUF342 family protein